MAAAVREEASGGYDFETVALQPKELLCVICHLLLREAMELPCSHIFCKSCLKKWEQNKLQQIVGKKSKKKQPSCSLCNTKYSKGSEKTNRPIDRMVTTECNIHCERKGDGCEWIGTISEYESSKHLEEKCLFKEIQCIYHEVGCQSKFLRRDEIQHFRDESNRGVHTFLLLKAFLQTKSELHETRDELKNTKVILHDTVSKLVQTTTELHFSKAALQRTDSTLRQANESVQLNFNEISDIGNQLDDTITRLDGVDSAVACNEYNLVNLQTSFFASTKAQEVLKQTVRTQGLLLDDFKKAVSNEQWRLNDLTRKTADNHIKTKMWVSVTCVGAFSAFVLLYCNCNKVYGKVERLVSKIVANILKQSTMERNSSFFFK